MSKLSRTKGKVWEREVARMFRAYFGGGALIKRGHQTRSGRDGADVEGTPFWIECKHQRNCTPEAALVQAEEASGGAGDKRTSIAVCKSHRGKPFVVLRLDRFLALAGLTFKLPHDPYELLRGLRPVNLAQLAEAGALDRDFTVTTPTRGKSTLLAPAMRSRRPK